MLNDAAIAFPPIDEQAAIVRLLNATKAFMTQQSSEMEELESALTQLDQSILAKAFRGELVPQDPNDEPASVLLKRIRAARAAKATQSSRTKATTT